MEILSAESLQAYGVNLGEVQKALKIQCFGKSFLRKSDVPKKFREKALFQASELLSKGEQSFVTETNFSYTVWAEEKVKTEIKKTAVTRQATSSNSQSQYNSRQSASSDMGVRKRSNNFVREENPSTKVIFNDQNEVNTQWNVTISNGNAPHKNQQAISQEKYQTYRGVAFSVQEKVEEVTNTPTPKKPRTYRGVTY